MKVLPKNVKHFISDSVIYSNCTENAFKHREANRVKYLWSERQFVRNEKDIYLSFLSKRTVFVAFMLLTLTLKAFVTHG